MLMQEIELRIYFHGELFVRLLEWYLGVYFPGSQYENRHDDNKILVRQKLLTLRPLNLGLKYIIISQCWKLIKFAMPEICDKKHGLVKSWVYYARLPCEINQ